MAKQRVIGTAGIEVRATGEKIAEDVRKIKQSTRAHLEQLEKNIAKIKPSIETNLLKKNISEIKSMHNVLQKQLETKIKLNADYASIQRTKQALDAVSSALKNINPKGEIDALLPAAKWGIIGTGITNTINFLKDFKNQVKSLVEQSLDLDVLRANFEGTEDDIKGFNKAVAGTVSEANLIKMASQAKELGMDVQQTTILMAMAENAADKLGGSTEENFNKLVNATEGADRGLKALGIRKAVYQGIVDNLAEAEGNTIENLDAEIQKRIRVEALLKASNVTYDEAINKVADNADKYAQLQKSINESELAFGRFIANGLIPAIDAMNSGGPSVKTFVGGLIGIGGIVMQIIPSLVQLKTLKELLRLATLGNAAATQIETSAIVANSAALTTNKSLSLGLIGKVGAIAAVGVAVYELTEFINKNTEAIKRNRDQADIKFPNWDKSGFGSKGVPNAGKDVGLSWVQNHIDKTKELLNENIKDGKAWTAKGKTVGEVQQQIEKLALAQRTMIAGSVEYLRNLTEIKRLNSILSPTEKPKTKASEELYNFQTEFLKQLASELELKDRIKEVTKEISDTESGRMASLMADMAIGFRDEDLKKIEEKLSALFDNSWDKISASVREKNLQAISDLGNALDNAFSESGNSFVTKLNKALQAAIQIANIIQKASEDGGGVGASGVLGIITSLIPFIASLNVRPGSAGGINNTPQTGPIIANSLSSTNVMMSYRNSFTNTASFNDRSIVQRLDQINGSIQAMSINIVRSKYQPSSINTGDVIKKLAYIITAEQQQFERSNIKDFR